MKRILLRSIRLPVLLTDNCFSLCDLDHTVALILRQSSELVRENAVKRHLTLAEIEQYVNRSGGVDEIIAIAEHLEACFECRDRAVAIVDPGDERSVRSEGEAAPEARPAVPWRLIVICVAIVVTVSAILVVVLNH